MAEFYTTNGISHHIEEIIKKAERKLVLVSPYLQISSNFYERLKDANKRGVKIVIIYGKDELQPSEKNSLAELENIELYFKKNHHVKCYFNEHKLIITSMNMYEFSEKNNKEIGVLFDKKEDSKIFEETVKEILSIKEHSEKIILQKVERILEVSSKKVVNGKIESFTKQTLGFCIRCSEKIKYNIDRPYCGKCFKSWVEYENTEYPEKYCHKCGEFESTTMDKPMDLKCYKLWQKEY